MKCFWSGLSLYSVAFSVSVSLCFMPYVLTVLLTPSTLCFLLTFNLFCYNGFFFLFSGEERRWDGVLGGLCSEARGGQGQRNHRACKCHLSSNLPVLFAPAWVAVLVQLVWKVNQPVEQLHTELWAPSSKAVMKGKPSFCHPFVLLWVMLGCCVIKCYTAHTANN